MVYIRGKHQIELEDLSNQKDNDQQHPLKDFLKHGLSSPTGVTQAPKEFQVSVGITPSVTNVPVDTIKWLSNLLILRKGDLSWRRE